MLDAFYSTVLPGQGAYALFEGPRKRHVWCDSLDELTRETEARAEMPDLYFATASFVEPTERTIANALYRRAFCFDIDAGPAKVAKHGLEKVYATWQDALAAVLAWTSLKGLCPAYVIHSGAGLHVYFVLDHDLDIDDWLPLAKGLKARALADGLKIDPSVTSDAARILRPPGALHNNGERVRVLGTQHSARCTPEQIHAIAGVLLPQAEVPRRKSINDDVMDNLYIGPPKSLVKIVKGCASMAHAVGARGDVSEPYWRAMLGVIKHTMEGADAAHAASEGHPDYDYDETQRKFDRWTAGPATCASFEAENPAACAACPHRGKIKSPITVGELNVREAAALPAPAPVDAEPDLVSETFGGFGGGDDDEAPGLTAATTSTQAASNPWDGYVPPGFSIARTAGGFSLTGQREVITENEVGEKVKSTITVPFAAVPFWFESWAPGTHENDQAQSIYCVYDATRKTTTRFTMPTKNAANRDSLLGTLAGQNVQVFPSTAQSKAAMEDYVKASLERIRAAGQRQKILERFGTMHDSHGNLVIAQGRHLIHHDGSVCEGVVQEKLRQRASAYCVPLPVSSTGKWGEDVWDDHILPRAQRHIDYLREFYSDDNFRPYQLAIMLAWASPMLAYMQGSFHPGAPLPGIGLTVSLYSPESGIGKTAAMHAAALAFGVPTGIAIQMDDTSTTDNARQALLLQSGTMPGFMDEMEKIEPKVLAGFVSSVGNGSTKLRMTKDLSLTGGVTTALVNVMSTNKSHREIAAADRVESAAVQMRLLEIDCSGVARVGDDVRRRETEARSSLHDCAGALGAVLHYDMCRLGSTALNKIGMGTADAACRRINGQQDGRFMWRALGALMAVHALLARRGLAPFDLDVLCREFQTWHDAGYQFAQDYTLSSEGTDMLSLMLSDLAAHTLITRTESHRGGGDDRRMDAPLNDRIPDDVQARSVLDGGYIYVKTDAIRAWAAKRRVSHQGLIARARESGALEVPDLDQPGRFTMRKDLFKGTKLSQGVPVSVVKIRIDKIPGADRALAEQVADNVRDLKSKAA